MKEKIVFISFDSFLSEYNNRLPPGRWRKDKHGYVNIDVEREINQYCSYYKTIANYNCGCKLQIHLNNLHSNISYCQKHDDSGPDWWDCGCSKDRWGMIKLCKYHNNIYLQYKNKLISSKRFW